MSIKQKIIDGVTKIIAKMIGGVSQSESDEIVIGKITEGMPETLREVAAEGAVLLKNDSILPLKKGDKVSLFGRVQFDYFFTGYGSGGDVRKPYVVNLVDGIRNNSDIVLNEQLVSLYEKWIKSHEAEHGFWAHWPRSYPEMPLQDSDIDFARKDSDVALVVIGRSSGEDMENTLAKGSYYLRTDEETLLQKVCSKFDKVVVLLNIGCIMDCSWINKYKIGAAMIVWQGGMESGNAIADLLSGKVCPSGKLAATIVNNYYDYPSAKQFGHKKYNNYEEDVYVGYRYFETFKKDCVQFPFGYGLSYTKFDIKFIAAKTDKNITSISCKVTNIGSVAGKEVVQVYLQKPCTKEIGNAYRELVAYEKTNTIQPNESQEFEIIIPEKSLINYDAEGSTGHKSAWVIQVGTYVFSLGNNVREAKDIYSLEFKNTKLYKQVSEGSAPRKNFDIMIAKKDGNEYKLEKVPVITKKTNLKTTIINNIPKDIPLTGDKRYKLIDVKTGKISLNDFIAQLSLEELEAISRGDYTMDSPLGPKGNAGAFGGVLSSMREKGISAVTTTDGPSGIRLFTSCSLVPIGSLLACTYNKDLVEKLYSIVGQEMVERKTDILLAPGMNIQRTPLCGRNFEYYSEDPLVTGTMASAVVKGVQSQGVSACPKHFACNNQEFARTINDSRVSERALREIYLKGFEICVNESKPKTIMTSYNRINGVWGHYNYELCTEILRREWGFEGCVMTDWWMQYKKSPEFRIIKSNAYRVRAGVNVLMPGGKRMGARRPDGTLLASYGKPEGITLGEMQQNAKYVLNFVINSESFKREHIK